MRVREGVEFLIAYSSAPLAYVRVSANRRTLLWLMVSKSAILTFGSTDSGKQAHYIALWATGEDQHSPQSEAFSLMIT